MLEAVRYGARGNGRVDWPGETADHVALLARPAWRAAAVFPRFPIWLKILASGTIAVDNHDLKFSFLNYRDLNWLDSFYSETCFVEFKSLIQLDTGALFFFNI